jgi:hypothetical protein
MEGGGGGGGGGGGMSPSTQPILDAAGEFLWSDELQESLDAFSKNHASMFENAPPDATEGGEQRLEWTQAHIDFKALFEFQLEQFVATQAFSQEEFLAACQDALDHGTWANCKGLVEVVLSMSTYEHFLRMMIAAAEPNPFESDDLSAPGGPLAADATLAEDDDRCAPHRTAPHCSAAD